LKPAPPQEREKELPARRSRERAYHKQGGERPVPRLVRELGLVAVLPTIVAGSSWWASASE